jgi:hypothetical protein
MNLSQLQKKRVQIERDRAIAISGFDEQLATIDSVLEGLAKLGIGEPIPAPSVVKRGGGVVKEGKQTPHKSTSGKHATTSAAPGKKICPKCDKEKSRDEFGKNKATKDGLQSYCKPCTNAYAARKASAGDTPLKQPKTAKATSTASLAPQPGGGLQRRCSTCNKVKPIGEYPEGGSDCMGCVEAQSSTGDNDGSYQRRMSGLG